MVVRSNFRAPDGISRGDKSSRQYMERLNDAQIAPGMIMLWGKRSPPSLDPAPPLGWLKMDGDTTGSTGTRYLIKEYRELAYSGSPYVVLNEAGGYFTLIEAVYFMISTINNNMRFVIKT